MNVLVFNCGSSSLKYKLLSMPSCLELAGGEAQRVGPPTAKPSCIFHRADGGEKEYQVAMPDHAKAFEEVMKILKDEQGVDVHAIGHLTGRLIGRRDGYPVNVSAVIEACAEAGTCLELNAYPERLDMTDVVCREAAQAGVKVALGTDAHRSSHYRLMQFGVATARRGRLEKGDVINCMTAKRLLELLRSLKG